MTTNIMTTNMKTLARPFLALAGLLLFLQQGIACTDDDDDPGLWTELECASYCNRANQCDPDVDEDECESDCLSQLANCRNDEREAAQAQLDECVEVSCDEFTACTIDAGLQCYFGL